MAHTKVDLQTSDGVMSCQAFTPPGGAAAPGVIFYMDAFGIRPDIEAMAERLASNGYFVLLPDVFHRSAPFAPFDPATVFSGGPDRDRLMAIVKATTSDMTMRDTAACLEYLARHSGVLGKAVGVTGYCMGGRAAMMAAGTFPDRIAAAGIIHAWGLATDWSDSPHLRAGKIRATLYIAVAALDQKFPEEERELLRETLEDACVPFTLEVYPGVAHGFAVQGLPVYNHDAAERHWRELLRLFAETLPSREQT
jgi:carboxymethylenebutenolidase